MTWRDAVDKVSGLLFWYFCFAALIIIGTQFLTPVPFEVNEDGDRVLYFQHDERN